MASGNPPGQRDMRIGRAILNLDSRSMEGDLKLLPEHVYALSTNDVKAIASMACEGYAPGAVQHS